MSLQYTGLRAPLSTNIHFYKNICGAVDWWLDISPQRGIYSMNFHFFSYFSHFWFSAAADFSLEKENFQQKEIYPIFGYYSDHDVPSGSSFVLAKDNLPPSPFHLLAYLSVGQCRFTGFSSCVCDLFFLTHSIKQSLSHLHNWNRFTATAAVVVVATKNNQVRLIVTSVISDQVVYL